MTLAGLVVAVLLGWTSYAVVTWGRFGRVAGRTVGDPLLDRFLPEAEVRESHAIEVNAPAEFTYAAAGESDFDDSWLVRCVFRAREILLGAQTRETELPHGILAKTRALGWGTLAEEPGQAIAMGAVTQPWRADVEFRALAPEEFRAFHDAGWVKIAWTLRAEARGEERSVFRTETRVAPCGEEARRRFRMYWAWLSPGILVIRWALLGPVKREAERRFRETRESR